jgi:hypothetical protein
LPVPALSTCAPRVVAQIPVDARSLIRARLWHCAGGMCARLLTGFKSLSTGVVDRQLPHVWTHGYAAAAIRTDGCQPIQLRMKCSSREWRLVCAPDADRTAEEAGDTLWAAGQHTCGTGDRRANLQPPDAQRQGASTALGTRLHHLCARLCVSLSVGEGERASARRARASALCTLSTTRLEVRDRSKTHHSVGTCAMREGWCIVRPARLCVCAGLSGCVCGLHGALTDIALLCVLLLVI